MQQIYKIIFIYLHDTLCWDPLPMLWKDFCIGECVMKKLIGIFVLAALSLGLVLPTASAQSSKPGNIFEDRVQMDKTVHDFGDILLSDGPVTAVFTAKNIGKDPLVIYNVVSSCGCTDVQWTRQPIKPGETGTIQGTYDNRGGAFPFDKSLTVYFSGIKMPLILRLRGESHEKQLTLTEAYPLTFGSLGIKEAQIKAGNMLQGEQKGGEVTIANLGAKPLELTFKNVSEGLSLSVSPNPVPPKSRAWLQYTVVSDRSRWGLNWYYATPVVNGKEYKAVASAVVREPDKTPGAEALRTDQNENLGAGHSQIGIFAITRENFSDWTPEQRENGSRPMLNASTSTFPKVKAGTIVSGSFPIQNQGKSDLIIYKVDSDSNQLKAVSVPTIAPGGKGTLLVSLDTSGFPSGDILILLTMYTNSPLRPIVNLFLIGWIE